MKRKCLFQIVKRFGNPNLLKVSFGADKFFYFDGDIGFKIIVVLLVLRDKTTFNRIGARFGSFHSSSNFSCYAYVLVGNIIIKTFIPSRIAEDVVINLKIGF